MEDPIDIEVALAHRLLRSEGVLDCEELLKAYRTQDLPKELVAEWVQKHLLDRGTTSKRVQVLLAEQLAEAVRLRLRVREG